MPDKTEKRTDQRIVLIRPCCIGDVVLATAALSALRRGYPDAHITWAVGGWSRRAVDYHPALNDILDTGQAALPVKSVGGFWRFVSQLRAGKFDLAVSLVRSPLMSLAVWLSGIPQRAGIDSNGRGFSYNLRLPIDPAQPRHEAEIYLDVVRLLEIDTSGIYANLPVLDAAHDSIQSRLSELDIRGHYIIVNPAGGGNPGMRMDSKRWPADYLATVADTLVAEWNASLILLGGPADEQLIQTLHEKLQIPARAFVGDLSFPEIGALAADALLYIGNDTGLTHLAAASGAKTVMILGPSDPQRYAPYTPNSLALWKPTHLAEGGVAASSTSNWNWARDGIQPDEALEKIRAFLIDDDA